MALTTAQIQQLLTQSATAVAQAMANPVPPGDAERDGAIRAGLSAVALNLRNVVEELETLAPGGLDVPPGKWYLTLTLLDENGTDAGSLYRVRWQGDTEFWDEVRVPVNTQHTNVKVFVSEYPGDNEDGSTRQIEVTNTVGGNTVVLATGTPVLDPDAVEAGSLRLAYLRAASGGDKFTGVLV